MGKQEFAFAFINEGNPEWAQLARDFEKLLFTDIEAALMKARKLTEHLIEDVYIKEEIDYPKYAKHAERIMILKNSGVVDEDLFKAIDRIRRMGNFAVHDKQPIPFSDGLKVHFNLYSILKWYTESYLSFEIKVPEYQDPKPENLDAIMDDKFKKLLQEYLPNYLKELGPINRGTSPEKEYDSQDELKMPTLHGSHLLYQLNKLRESSQGAVEGFKGLSEFKQYLHVKRSIEEKLEAHVRESAYVSGSKLIFLCGSVGDGKSHLLAHLATKMPEIMNRFKKHNDATESFNPRKNSLDTLAEVLDAFSDNNIDTSDEKLILAINLGVLNNFIESHYADQKYQKLKEFISSANVFEANTITIPLENEHFVLVNFADYKTFELTVDGPVSSYLFELFQRITQQREDNPFYQAYLKDKEELKVNPLLINFEMFSGDSVQKQIIQLIIKTITKDKVIVSSRALLNFIYDILAPASVDEIRTSDFIDMLPSLLPNLLFEGIEKSHFLRMLANHDPIHRRIKGLDEKLISLNNAGSYYMFFRDVIYDPAAQNWMNLLEPIEEVGLLDKDTKRELSELFIRSTFLYESHLQNAFQDNVYSNYMKYLYAYNTDKKPMLQNLYYEIEKAIYLWKGSPKNNYLYIDDEGSNIRIAEPLHLKKAPITIKNEKSDVVERFTPTLFLGFRCEPQPIVHEVEIDLPLYGMVNRVLNGYRLNKKDREDSIQFIDFIEKLLPFGKQQEEILIRDNEHHLSFRLQFDADFEVYSFSREQ
ncbi:DNA phosphorothioation-dependent restriction protein DptF [Priestia megaterium]|uniref:DNA phosphorothioation-dependent restriction protein DptF n=1 Tax=Priestia megaterium TaxID=1404 RepID=A0A6H1P503_PRIMG|nr:DNA phosphorothioation-dependent restriction protein DptF [Priestia megaterium]QIZ08497.1 DNA phosphorothioation-dependent restriction protein DptF [Priestia megaterium]